MSGPFAFVYFVWSFATYQLGESDLEASEGTTPKRTAGRMPRRQSQGSGSKTPQKLEKVIRVIDGTPNGKSLQR